jgi:hypothetical protein
MDSTEREHRWSSAGMKRSAAQLCLDQGYFSESITLSYYACYQGMWVAVAAPRTGLWRHGGLINEFCRGRWLGPLVVPQVLAPLRKKLDLLYVWRIQSDYEARSLSRNEAQEALDIAHEVLSLVAQHKGLRWP